MGLFFLFGFILWGWAEMSLFIYIGGEIGGLLTLFGVFVTAIIGLSLLKSQGMAVMIQVRDDIEHARVPVGSIVDSIALVVGGVFMLVPGYVTDCIGILFFVPGFRTIAGAWILHQLYRNSFFKGSVHFNKKSDSTPKSQQPYEDGDIIEGNFTEHSSSNNRLNNEPH